MHALGRSLRAVPQPSPPSSTPNDESFTTPNTTIAGIQQQQQQQQQQQRHQKFGSQHMQQSVKTRESSSIASINKP
jgi:hypothetical protein